MMSLEEREDGDWLNAARRFFNSYKDAPDFDMLLLELLRLGLASEDASLSLAQDASASGTSADLQDECLSAVLPLCEAPEVESLVGLYNNGPETSPDAPRIPHFMSACNAALGELQSLQIPSHHFRDAATIRMQTSGCSDNSDCKCMMPDALLMAEAVGEEAAMSPTDTAPPSTDANAKTVPKQANTDPKDNLASIFFSFKPGSNSSDAPPNEYTTRERTTQRQSKVNALRELDTYSVHGVYAHASGQPGRQLNMRMGKVAAQILAALPEMLWTISLLILGEYHNPFAHDTRDSPPPDSKALVCCIDREGIMHLSGIDIIVDLPRFLVLLFALQRLPRSVVSLGDSSEYSGAARTEHRGLQTVSAELLQPMVKLTSEPKEFVKGFFQITEAHYKAWINGVKHGDPTLDNLLYRKA